MTGTGIRKSETFRRYLTRFLIIFMIPVAVSTFFILRTYIYRTRTEIINRNIDYVHNAAEMLTDRLTAMNNIAYKSCANINLTCYRADIFPEQAVQEVKIYEQINDFSTKMLFYTVEQQRIFSSISYNAASDMMGRLYEDGDSVLNKLVQIDKPFLFPAESMFINNEYNNYIAYAVPIPYGSEYQDRVWIFLIDENTVQNLTDSTIPISDSVVMIISQNQLIYSSESSFYETDPEFLESAFESGTYSEQEILGEKHMVFSTDAQLSGMPYTIVMMAPNKVIMREYTNLIIWFIVTYAGILIAGFAMIIFFSYKNYNPIRRVMDTLFGDRENAATGDDISFIQNAIDGLMAKTRNLEQYVQSSDEAIKQNLIIKFLHRQIPNIGELEKRLGDIGYYLEGRYYTVVCIYTSGDADNTSGPIVVETAEKLSCEGITVVGTYYISMNLFVFIVGMDMDENINAFVINLLQLLRDKHDIRATASMGNRYPREGMVYKAFPEARIALQFMPIYGEGTVIGYDGKIDQVDFSIMYPKQAEMKIIEAIRSRDKEQTESAFDAFINELRARHIPYFYMRHIYFTLIDSIDQLQIGWKSESFSENLYEVLRDSFSSSSRDIFNHFAQLKKIIINALQNVEVDTRLITLISAYIKDNYQKYSFSIAVMADHFNISTSYMRRYFKKITGKTMQEYLDDIRFERAIHLLQQPHVPIKKIVSDIGYSDYSSFIRKFKRVFGYTPAEYRKRYLLSRE